MHLWTNVALFSLLDKSCVTITDPCVREAEFGFKMAELVGHTCIHSRTLFEYLPTTIGAMTMNKKTSRYMEYQLVINAWEKTKAGTEREGVQGWE